MERKPYPSDVSDDEWALVAPYLTLIMEEAPQREHSLREVFNGLHWIVRAGAAWRLMPHDLPPWHTGVPAEPTLAQGQGVRSHCS
jgi:transposase